MRRTSRPLRRRRLARHEVCSGVFLPGLSLRLQSELEARAGTPIDQGESLSLAATFSEGSPPMKAHGDELGVRGSIRSQAVRRWVVSCRLGATRVLPLSRRSIVDATATRPVHLRAAARHLR